MARDGRGLLLLGPSGAGKSGLAAEMLMLGATLVADDLLVLDVVEEMLCVSGLEDVEADPSGRAVGGGRQRQGEERRAAGAPGEAGPDFRRPMELRGIGIVQVAAIRSAPVRGAVSIGPSPGRLPQAEWMELLDRRVPLVRHPAGTGLAAKALLWLASLPPITPAR